VVYDKTIFKPEELDTLGRYSFSLVDAGEASGQSDDSPSSDEDSDASPDQDTEPPSQFDLGDFSKMKPADAPANDGGQEDELPLLGGPDVDK
jgi:hypothetical protein